jgi:hypothetical protein
VQNNGDAPVSSRGFRPEDYSFRGHFVLGTPRYKNKGDGLSRGRIIGGRIVRAPYNDTGIQLCPDVV